MNLAEMTNEEWEEVRKHHDALVHMGELELRAEGIREFRSDTAARHAMGPVELELHELDDMVVNIPH